LDDSLVNSVIILFLLLIGILFKKVYLPKIKGAKGEFSVALRLRRLNKKEYKVYNNIYLKIGGITTQIDHLVISVYGIFVIETKNYKGWIFGNESSRYWTQILYNEKNKIYNPIKQNWSHINFLKRLSPDFKDLQYFPIIVFAGSAKLKKVKASVPVIYKGKLLKTIRKNKIIYLTHSQLEIIDQLLEQAIIEKKEAGKKHKKFVRSNIKRKRRKPDPVICPKCGGKLVNRIGKYGSFRGCSNYPECKYTVRKS